MLKNNKKSRLVGERRVFMGETKLKLVVDNQPVKKKDRKKQAKKMQCRIFRQRLRSSRGREEYLDDII